MTIDTDLSYDQRVRLEAIKLAVAWMVPYGADTEWSTFYEVSDAIALYIRTGAHPDLPKSVVNRAVVNREVARIRSQREVGRKNLGFRLLKWGA